MTWNFEKWLLGKDGTVLKRWETGVKPDSAVIDAAIKAALAKWRRLALNAVQAG